MRVSSDQIAELWMVEAKPGSSAELSSGRLGSEPFTRRPYARGVWGTE